MAALSTAATRALEKAQVEFTLHSYELVESEGTYGESVARNLGVSPERLFKTLVAEVDGRPVVAVVPVAGKLGLKALAKAAGGKRAQLAEPADAERWTGYVTGGISPFGQKRRMPVFVDDSVLTHATIFASAGRRGLQVELEGRELVRILEAEGVEGLTVVN